MSQAEERSTLAAVSQLSQELGAAFSIDAIQCLATQLVYLHEAALARVEGLAQHLGVPRDPSELRALAWVVVFKETSRFIAIGAGPEGKE